MMVVALLTQERLWRSSGSAPCSLSTSPTSYSRCAIVEIDNQKTSTPSSASTLSGPWRDYNNLDKHNDNDKNTYTNWQIMLQRHIPPTQSRSWAACRSSALSSASTRSGSTWAPGYSGSHSGSQVKPSCLDSNLKIKKGLVEFHQCPGRTRHLTKSAAGHVLGLPNTTTPDFNFAACR